MKNNNNPSSSHGLGVASILGIVFIVLKLCGVIDWSWIWVLCPFWIGMAIWAIVLIALAILYIIVGRD